MILNKPVANKGFTLIEMLVVLVILALTTTLMTQGLSTTWQNFSRLGARDLVNSSAQLPVSWFAQSLQGALLYHPNKVLATGDTQHFGYITFSAPDQGQPLPQPIVWAIESSQSNWQLSFSTDGEPVVLANFPQATRFEYLVNQQWQPSFQPEDGQLPTAVRVISGEAIWALAKIGRPEQADMPAELPLFGEYEF